MSSHDHPGRDRLAKVLMVVLAISTLAAFASSALAYPSTPPDRTIVEAWRMLTYPVFGGVFLLLAWFPRRMPGLWELAFYQKAGVAIFVAVFAKAAAGQAMVVAVDGSLATLILVCYGLTEGWRAWRRSGAQSG